MPEIITVLSGNVWPGCHSERSESHYFPELTWKVYEDNFKAILDDPSLPDEQWPMYSIWHRMLMKIFGYLPTDEHTMNQGRAWQWHHFRRAAMKLAVSVSKKGFQQGAWPAGENILACIGSDGKVCIVQGNKRTALVRLLHGPDFPLKVGVRWRSEDWKKLKLGVYPPGKDELYQPIEHPDLQGKKVAQPCKERWKMIQDYLKGRLPNSSVLDLGCHTGWFCRRFAEKGCQTFGMDNEPEAIQLANIMNTWSERPPGYKHTPAYELGNVLEFTPDTSYDICLCMSIIFHLFAQKGKDAGYSFLHRLSQTAPVMFLDCGWAWYAKHLPFTKSTIQPEIIKHTKFSRCKMLGITARESRPLYVFER